MNVFLKNKGYFFCKLNKKQTVLQTVLMWTILIVLVKKDGQRKKKENIQQGNQYICQLKNSVEFNIDLNTIGIYGGSGCHNACSNGQKPGNSQVEIVEVYIEQLWLNRLLKMANYLNWLFILISILDLYNHTINVTLLII